MSPRSDVVQSRDGAAKPTSGAPTRTVVPPLEPRLQDTQDAAECVSWQWTVANFGDRTMLIKNGEKFTFAEVGRRANAFAVELQRRGVKPGDRVVTAMDLSIQGHVALLAIYKVGAIAAPLRPQLVQEQLHRMVSRMEPTLCIVSRRLFDAYTDLDICPVMCVDEPLAAPPDDSFEEFVWAPEDTMFILHSSGSTGDPKGIEHPVRHFLLPPYHEDSLMSRIFRTSSLTFVNYAGCQCVWDFYDTWRHGTFTVLASKDVFEEGAVDEWIDLVNTHGIERLMCLGSVLAGVARAGKMLPKVKVAAPCGVVLSEPLLRQALELVPNALWINGYGMSEAGKLVVHVICAPGEPIDAEHLTAVGKPVPGVEVCLAGPLLEVDGHQAGEVLLKSAQLMKGYWRSPEMTASAVEDGWLRTGDLGRVDADGNLYLVGRKKDIIILPSGVNITPKDIEDALVAHDRITIVAVVGAPAPEGVGEQIVAFVVGDAPEEDLRKHLATKLAAFQLPSRIVYLDTMPLMPSGKVSKQELREMALEDV